MDDNPYKAVGDPNAPQLPRAGSGDLLWSAFFCAVVGFGGGTLLMMQFVLSIDVREKTIGGMIWGGIPFAMIGAIYGWRRWKRKHRLD